MWERVFLPCGRGRAGAAVATAIMALATSGLPVRAEAPPAPREPPLGRAHIVFKIARADLDHDVAAEWGVDQETYVGIEGYGGHGAGGYYGGELGHARTASATTAEGEMIRDFDFLSLELNWKQAFGLAHGLSFDAGAGSALFYADGEEVGVFGGEEISTALADLGFGFQVFGGFNWRVRHLLIGLDAKYQWAYDILNIDYSNLRLGGPVGVVF